MEEYTGPKKRCDWCENVFRKYEKIAVVSLGFVFCSPKFGEEHDCIKRWKFEHRISEIEFHQMLFSGSRPDSGDLAYI